jgi:DnaJ-class molecular chaperone
MAQKQDLYGTLGVAREADHETIRKAYRKLARENHPDLNPDDKLAEERFKKISAAWAVLSDTKRRRDYDEFGDVSLESGFDADEVRNAREAFGARFGQRARSEPGSAEDAFQFGGIDDLLGRMFGAEGAGRRGLRLRGADLEASLELDFLEAIRGGEKQLSLDRPTEDGGVETRTVRVRIPPGVDTNGRLRIPGKGGAGIGGGPAGDLWVTLRVRPHHVFRRERKNLTLDLPISVREATLGARVEVPTLDGRATLTIPPGTDGGTRLRLRGKGVPAAGKGEPGDLLVRVKICVPRNLDAEAEAAINALGRFEDPALRKELFS